MKDKLYIDIDGVLLTTRNQQAAKSITEFIQFAIKNFDCYWLTTHCKGDANTAINYLTQFLSVELIEQLKNVKPTNWDTLKTEAIDFSSNFIWLDDFPFQSEVKILEDNDCANNLLLVDLNNDNELLEIIEYLK